MASVAVSLGVGWIVYCAWLYRRLNYAWSNSEYHFQLEDIVFGPYWAVLGAVGGGIAFVVMLDRMPRTTPPRLGEGARLRRAYLIAHCGLVAGGLFAMRGAATTQDSFPYVVGLSFFLYVGLVMGFARGIVDARGAALMHGVMLAVGCLGVIVCWVASGGVWMGDTSWGKSTNWPWYLWFVSMGVSAWLLMGSLFARGRSRARDGGGGIYRKGRVGAEDAEGQRTQRGERVGG